MKWSEVTYVLHGLRCTILYDSSFNPGVVERRTGKIDCEKMGDVATLHKPDESKAMLPPDCAVVVLHPPLNQNLAWL